MDLDVVKRTKILLVDDDETYTKVTKMYLENNGLSIQSFNNPIEALEYCKKNKIDIILLDYFMPEMTGEEFLKELRKFDTRAVVILQTGFAEEKPPIETLTALDIQGYYDKTKGVQDLLLMILSTIKTVSLLLYRNNPDTNNIEYSFMSVGVDIEDDNADEGNDVSLGFELDIVSKEIGNDDNSEIGTVRIF